jgi:hypothetical protein
VIPGHTVIHKDYAIYWGIQNRNRQKRGIGDTKFGRIVRYELEIADIGLSAPSQAHPHAACRRTDGGGRKACFSSIFRVLCFDNNDRRTRATTLELR